MTCHDIIATCLQHYVMSSPASVVARHGTCRDKLLTLSCLGNMSATCQQHSQHSLRVTQKKTTTLTREKCPPMLVPRNQANGKGNLQPLPQSPLSALAQLFLPPWRTTMVGPKNLLRKVSVLKEIMSLSQGSTYVQ